MRLTPRKRLLVDPKVQGALVVRVVAYWCFYALVVSQVLLCWKIVESPNTSFFQYFDFAGLWRESAAVAIAALIVLPVLLVDVLRVSNRFAGPIFRMRRSLRSLAAGEYAMPVQLRKGDFCEEVADEINALAAYVENLKARLGAIEPQAAAECDTQCAPAAIR